MRSIPFNPAYEANRRESTMCTAIALTAGQHYLGRSLDLHASLGERVILCPRRFPLPLRHLPILPHHHAFIGMAHVQDGFPLYYDAVSEHGLAMAALNFPHFCAYHDMHPSRKNLAPFELIPYVLGTCKTLAKARAVLESITLCDTAFSPECPNTPLHFILASAEGCLVIESMEDGLHVYDNPAGVMTNSPPFPFHMQRLADFMGLTSEPPSNRFSPALPLRAYSFGMGALGLPGDLSSSSRFVRAAFARANSPDGENDGANQLFHLLDFVSMPRGCVRLEDGRLEYTVYTSCMSLETGIYYYKTYENSAVRSASLSGDLDGTDLTGCT